MVQGARLGEENGDSSGSMEIRAQQREAKTMVAMPRDSIMGTVAMSNARYMSNYHSMQTPPTSRLLHHANPEPPPPSGLHWRRISKDAEIRIADSSSPPITERLHRLMLDDITDFLRHW